MDQTPLMSNWTWGHTSLSLSGSGAVYLCGCIRTVEKGHLRLHTPPKYEQNLIVTPALSQWILAQGVSVQSFTGTKYLPCLLRAGAEGKVRVQIAGASELNRKYGTEFEIVNPTIAGFITNGLVSAASGNAPGV